MTSYVIFSFGIITPLSGKYKRVCGFCAVSRFEWEIPTTSLRTGPGMTWIFRGYGKGMSFPYGALGVVGRSCQKATALAAATFRLSTPWYMGIFTV